MLDLKQEVYIKRFANNIRKGIISGIASFGAGHIGGSLSIADLVAVLYCNTMNVDPANPAWEDRDKLVVSKGHAGPALYAALALRGFFPVEKLKTLNCNGTDLPSHCDRIHTPGIDISTGSLGQGASLAAGFAMSDKMDGKKSRTFLIVGEGDLEEGQTWEAALFTAHYQLDHLVTLVDLNGMQVDGTTDEVCNLGNVAEKYRSFGFETIDVADGNDVSQIYNALEMCKGMKRRPIAIILHTVKGAGLSMYAGKVGCHFTTVTKEEADICMRELEDTDRELDNIEKSL